MQGVKYFLILQSLTKANQLCFVFVWFSCFHYLVLKGITGFSLEMLFEIPHLYQIPQCVQIFHVSNLLRPWKCNVWKLTPLKFQSVASQLSATGCLRAHLKQSWQCSQMFHWRQHHVLFELVTNILGLSFSYFFFSEYISGSLATKSYS